MGVVVALGKAAVRTVNAIINFALIIALLLLLAFGCYALWDSNNVATNATAAQFEVYKPAEDAASFEELRAINPEILGWLTVYGTMIDYPLVQGEDNAKYVNTSATGEYSLTGAIFLDYRNDKRFFDFNTIVYGHNMVPSVMFGSIKEFKEKSHFDNHLYGNLYYDGRDHGLELFAMLTADAYDGVIFSPAVEGEAARQDYLDNILATATYTRDVGVTISDRIILLSTCSADGTNARDILIGRIADEPFVDAFAEPEPEKRTVITVDGREYGSVWETLPSWAWMLIGLLLFLILMAVILGICRRAQQRNKRRRLDG